MSNVKEISIVADVPFNYLAHDSDLSAEDAALIAATLLGPSMGLSYTYTFAGLVPNDHGGKTTMYRIEIEGTEALSWPFLERLAMAFKKCSPLAKLHVASACDMEDSGDWVDIVKGSELSGEKI